MSFEPRQQIIVLAPSIGAGTLEARAWGRRLFAFRIQAPGPINQPSVIDFSQFQKSPGAEAKGGLRRSMPQPLECRAFEFLGIASPFAGSIDNAPYDHARRVIVDYFQLKGVAGSYERLAHARNCRGVKCLAFEKFADRHRTVTHAPNA
ncbi:MAG TPA: hypothetical protein VG270_12360, partial [Pseudolabrys sp.]|nr:hypothetical protein [Pseudolabrys sp.]